MSTSVRHSSLPGTLSISTEFLFSSSSIILFTFCARKLTQVMSKTDKSVWDTVLDQSSSEQDENKGEESSVFFLGSKNSGKTSIILRFLDRDEPPKPTTALEYTFGRKAKGHNLAKDVGHLWELGGGTWLSRLVDVPVNASTIKHTAAILVLDLSLPQELWFTLEKLLNVIKSRIDVIIREQPELREQLKEKMWERLSDDLGDDRDVMQPLPVPLVIIGSKYDIFQEFDPEQRKVICKTLRFVAHTYGAHLQFFSTKQEALMTKTRNLISHLLFNTSLSKTTQVDHNKPILMPAGLDSFQQIGNPPLSDGDIGKVMAKTPMELWKKAFTTFFPQDNVSDPSLVEDPSKDQQYAEAAIDAMRKQKDEELERYRRISERQMREAQRTAQVVM